MKEKEIWKTFLTNGVIEYQASNLGRFKRVGKRKSNYLKPYHRNCYENKRNRPHSVVIATSIDKKKKEYNCNKLIAELFIRKLKDDEVVINKNGDRLDLRVLNLFITTKKNLGHITGGKSSKSKKIYYYDNMDYRTSYPSARNLAKKLGVSYQTVLDIANGRTKNPKFKIVWANKEEGK